MGVISKFRTKNIVQGIRTILLRYPLAIFFLAFLTLTAILSVAEVIEEEKNIFFLLYYSGTAFLLNLIISLSEDENTGGFRKVIRAILLNVVWLGICLYIRHVCPFDDDISWGIALCVIPACLSAGVFLIPFLHKTRHDIAFWNFSVDMIWAGVIAGVAGLLLTGGGELLIFAFQNLFGIEYDSGNIYIYFYMVCMLFISPLAFLYIIPEKGNQQTARPGKTGLGLIHYLFMPLIAAYLLTLYVYAAKILFTWELPVGWVSWLVSVSMLCLVLLVFFLYNIQFREKSPRERSGDLDRKIIRYLPIVFLPLLLLMSAGIARRISDYGITIPRLYLIVFNLWCYAVCIVLIINKSRRIWWIPASFFIILFLTSVGPQNLSSITHRTLVKQVKTAIIDEISDNKDYAELFGPQDPDNAKDIFPLDSARYGVLMTRADSSFVVKVDDKLAYLVQTFPEDVARQVVDTTVGKWSFGDWAHARRNVVSLDAPPVYIDFERFNKKYDIPEGVTGLQTVSLYENIPYSDTLQLKIGEDSVLFRLPVEQLRAAQYDKQKDVILKNGNSFLYISKIAITRFDPDSNCSVSLDGVLLERK